jgi:hypothetical protein
MSSIHRVICHLRLNAEALTFIDALANDLEADHEAALSILLRACGKQFARQQHQQQRQGPRHRARRRQRPQPAAPVPLRLLHQTQPPTGD